MRGLQVRGPNVGVLALQGAFAAHRTALAELGALTREVRTRDHLNGIDALVMPGGESTTMSKLLLAFDMFDPIAARLADDMPVFGTCAGMILLAEHVADGRPDQRSFEHLPIDVRRNGYGRQIDSFETDLDIAGLDAPFHAVFIRAPVVEALRGNAEVLASVDNRPVLVRSGNALASSFHPELTPDRRVHQLFLDIIEGA